MDQLALRHRAYILPLSQKSAWMMGACHLDRTVFTLMVWIRWLESRSTRKADIYKNRKVTNIYVTILPILGIFWEHV